MIRENSCGGALVERPVPDVRSHEPGARYIMGTERKERSAKARPDCNGRNVRRTEGLKDGIPNRRNAWETERPASGTRVAGLQPAYVGAGKAQAESEGAHVDGSGGDGRRFVRDGCGVRHKLRACGPCRLRRRSFACRDAPGAVLVAGVRRRRHRMPGAHTRMRHACSRVFRHLAVLGVLRCRTSACAVVAFGRGGRARASGRLRALVERYRENEDSIEQRCARAARAFDLTRREEELLGLLLEGKTRSEMARQLYVSNDTVKTHLRNLYRKTGVSGKAELLETLSEMPSPSRRTPA